MSGRHRAPAEGPVGLDRPGNEMRFVVAVAALAGFTLYRARR